MDHAPMARPSGALIAVGFALLLAGWTVATLPFGAPDEASHYLRALSLANGQLVGPKVPYMPVPAGLTVAQLAWANQGTHAVRVPPRLSPPNVTCLNGNPDVRLPSCLEATEVGNYQPLAYLLPAVGLKVSSDATAGLWLSRLASAVPCLAFILLAAALLWDGSVSSLLGLLGAMSPMVLFVCSIVNPNGLEVAACLAFVASVLRITRTPERVPSGAWIALAASGAVAILCWQLGPVFVLADLALGAALLGPRGLQQLRSSPRRPQRLATFALLSAAILYVVYGLASGSTHTAFAISSIGQSLHDGLPQLGSVLRDSVGNFGSLTVHLPTFADWIWWLFVIAILATAMRLGNRRDRWLLTVVVALTLAFPVLFYSWVYRFTGFGLQGRYLLPMMVLIPLVAGEIVHRRVQALPSNRLRHLWPCAATVLFGVFQAYAWWFNARNTAGAPHTIRFYAFATWSPPLGWGPWIAITAIGTGAVLAFAAVGTQALTRTTKAA